MVKLVILKIIIKLQTYYLKPYSDKDEILQVFPKYTLTEGLAEKLIEN